MAIRRAIILILCSSVLLLTFGISIVLGKVEVDKLKELGTCLNETLHRTASDVNAIIACDDEMEKAGKEFLTVECWRACMFRQLGILDGDDKAKFNFSKFEQQIDSTLPQGAREGVKADAKKCFEAATSNICAYKCHYILGLILNNSEYITAEKGKLSEEEDNCASHETYQLCIVEAYDSNCGGETKIFD